MSEPSGAGKTFILYGEAGTGSMIIEAALALAGAPVDVVHVPWDQTGWNSPMLGTLNPLGQLPTLILPSGEVMTESAAILLHLAETYPDAALAPPVGDPDRPGFLRWLVFLVAAVYPTFTYGDRPRRWVEDDQESGRRLRRGTDEHRQMLLRHLEGVAGEPWFLGERFSALDLYFWVMRNWRPGAEWFAAECPRLDAIGVQAAGLPAVSAVDARNFPG
jgi:GST-like protein